MFQVEVIGGAEKYMAVCRRCYNSPSTLDRVKGSKSKENIMKNTKKTPVLDEVQHLSTHS